LTYGRHGIILDTSTGMVYILNNQLVFQLIENHPDIHEEFYSSKRKLRNREKALARLNARIK